jgi:hypothetical protein
MEGARPVDYVVIVIELVVAVIIGIEGFAQLVHWGRVRRHLKRVRPYHASGLALQQEFLTRFRSSNDPIAAVDWMKKVDDWTDATSEQIKRYSSEATAAFLRDSGGVIMRYGNQNSTFATYAWLEIRLNNLHGIIQDRDRYF